MGSYSVDEEMEEEEVCPKCKAVMRPICNVVVIDQHPEDNYVRCAMCKKIIRSQFGTTYEWNGDEERRGRRKIYWILTVSAFFIFSDQLLEVAKAVYGIWLL